MKKFIRECVVFAAIICLVSGNSFAQTLRNTDNISLGAGVFVSGDKLINDVFGPHFNAFGSINKTIIDNLAVLGKADYIYGKGSDSGIDFTRNGLKAGLSLVGLLLPGKPIDPYVLAGGLFEYNDVKASSGHVSESDSNNEFGFEVGGGIDCILTTKAFLDLGVLYQKLGSDFDSIAGNAKIGYALNKRITPFLDGGYSFDEKDYWGRVGVAVLY